MALQLDELNIVDNLIDDNKALEDGESDDDFDENSADLVDEPEDLTKQAALHNGYSFSYHRRGAKGVYEIIPIATCRTVSFIMN